MDNSAVNTNLTVDDFDSVVTYANQSQWVTPDPSADTFAPVNWWTGTYHKTDVEGASFTFNFTGYSLYIYGSKGKDYGQFSVSLSGNSTTVDTYSDDDSFSNAPTLLWSSTSLPYDTHNVTVTNLGKGSTQGKGTFLFDYLQAGFQVAPAGATVTNKTLEETDGSIKFSGTWNNNTSPNFSGGGTKYTNEDGASFELDFEGSAIYVFGDKKNDHRTYSVSLDNSAPVTLNGISGCGGEFGLTCEQQIPTIKYFASNLGAGTHHLKLANNAENASFFDLDFITITVPSQYGARNLSSTSSSSSSNSSSGGSGGSSGGSTSPNNSPLNFANVGIMHLLLFVLGVQMLLGLGRSKRV